MLRTRVLGRGTDSLADVSWHPLTWHRRDGGSHQVLIDISLITPGRPFLARAHDLLTTTIHLQLPPDNNHFMRLLLDLAGGSHNRETSLRTEEY